MDLNVVWFILLGVLMAGYAFLDGFDLGAGILHLFSRKEHRRVIMNAIGPVWDGNEVWLITFGGALFAAFRVAYATVFSTFYTAFMLLLCALIFRAASLEFRNKVDSGLWRSVWDFFFALSSFVAAVLFGVAVGNVLRGLAIKDLVYQGTFFDFLNVYSVLTGLLVAALFALHGALYLRMKSEGDLRRQTEGWIRGAFTLFVLLYGVVALYSVIALPHARASVLSWLVFPVNILAIYGVWKCTRREKPVAAFLCNGANMALMVVSFSAAMFPNLVLSSLDAASHLTIWNAANSPKTLAIMLGIVGAGLPLVLAYTAWSYWIFRGKVKVGPYSY